MGLKVDWLLILWWPTAVRLTIRSNKISGEICPLPLRFLSAMLLLGKLTFNHHCVTM